MPPKLHQSRELAKQTQLSQQLNEISQRPKKEDGNRATPRIAGMRAAANGSSCFWNGYGCAGDLWCEIERQIDISHHQLSAIGIAIAVIDLLVHHSGFIGLQEYAAIALGILASKAVIALPVGYAWGRQEARELKTARPNSNK